MRGRILVANVRHGVCVTDLYRLSPLYVRTVSWKLQMKVVTCNLVNYVFWVSVHTICLADCRLAVIVGDARDVGDDMFMSTEPRTTHVCSWRT